LSQFNWYTDPETKVIEWRRFRNSLQGVDDLIDVQKFWYSAPYKKVSQLHDENDSWPTPWTLFNNMSYCDLSKALGMFYTISLAPKLSKLPLQLNLMHTFEGERICVVSVDNGKYILNFNKEKIINTNNIDDEWQLTSKFVKTDFPLLL
jgi:hypothetical protein